MNVLVGFLIAIVTAALAIAAMLFVRRRAPEGSYFTTYDASRAGAETEAVLVAQQIETVQFFNSQASDELTAELVCHGARPPTPTRRTSQLVC